MTEGTLKILTQYHSENRLNLTEIFPLLHTLRIIGKAADQSIISTNFMSVEHLWTHKLWLFFKGGKCSSSATFAQCKMTMSSSQALCLHHIWRSFSRKIILVFVAIQLWFMVKDTSIDLEPFRFQKVGPAINSLL